jgi:hypothetical protein
MIGSTNIRTIFRLGLLVCVGGLICFGVTNNVLAFQEKAKAKTKNKKEETADSEPVEDVVFVPDFADADFEGSGERAWEYRPYKVAVWFCLDGAPALDSIYKNLARDVTRRSELLDPSGWDLTTGLAPPKWRIRFLNGIERAETLSGFKKLKALEVYDKLMIVCLENDFGVTRLRVREYDVQTQLWGPLLLRDVSQKHQLSNHITQAISVAFMPLAKIERVQDVEIPVGEKVRKESEVIMRLRAINSCRRSNSILDIHSHVVYDEEGNQTLQEIEATPIEESPVYISDKDRFLPIIRETDKNGDLARLTPIPFTFLTVKKQDVENAEVRCRIQSYQAAPLSQRKKKRAQKLALVIRPPKQPTTLYLKSQDKLKTPMEGFDVYSRSPNAVKGDKNEFLGKTDWLGSIEIPPSDEGLRIVLIGRGGRGLRRLPIIPGLTESVETTLPNDETRLFAEGVVQGLHNEVLSLVIRREVFEGDIQAALDDKNLTQAKELFDQYRNLESPQDIKERMTNEEIALKTQTADKRELDYINRLFETLRKIVNKQQRESKEMDITQAIQELNTQRRENTNQP